MSSYNGGVIVIREETPADYDAVREVNRRAFGQEDEARLVDALREAGVVVASLVAEEDGRIAGHILFTELAVETNAGPLRAAALAPMAVEPGRQRRGVGSALVRRGIEVCRARGYDVILVVGHRDYYPRFGFSPERARTLDSVYSCDAFMALELTPGALDGRTGSVRYPAPFSA